MVQYGTAGRGVPEYIESMRTEFMQVMLTVLWMLAIAPLGYAAGVTSHVGLIALLLLAVTPAIVMIRFWGAPARMSTVQQEVPRYLDRGLRR